MRTSGVVPHLLGAGLRPTRRYDVYDLEGAIDAVVRP